MKRIVLYIVLTLLGLSVYAQSGPSMVYLGAIPWNMRLFEDSEKMDLKGFSLAWEKDEREFSESLSAIYVVGKEVGSGNSGRGSNNSGDGTDNGDSDYMLTYLNASMGYIFGPASRFQIHVKPLAIGVGYTMSRSGNKFRFGYTPSALARFYVTDNLALNVECNVTTMDGGYIFLGAGLSYTFNLKQSVINEKTIYLSSVSYSN